MKHPVCDRSPTIAFQGNTGWSFDNQNQSSFTQSHKIIITVFYGLYKNDRSLLFYKSESNNYTKSELMLSWVTIIELNVALGNLHWLH